MATSFIPARPFDFPYDQCCLVADACASGDAYAHAAAVHMVTVEDGIFGVVANTDDVVAALHRLRPAARPVP